MAARKMSARFRVAFSFAGAERDFVRQIADEVERALGETSVFFDEWYEHALAGNGADLVLQRIYGQGSDLTVVCASASYEEKPWTKIEYEVIRARQMTGSSLALLPLRVAPGDVEGLPANAIVPDVSGRSPAEVARLILDRLNLLDEEVQDRRGTPRIESTGPAWSAFDPAKLHCLVIEAECVTRQGGNRLPKLVQEVFSSAHADRIWSSFKRLATSQTRLDDRSERVVADRVAAATRHVAARNVIECFASREALSDTIRLVVEADVALFDLTGFEPGVRFLLGVRAATRTGVTVASHGTWEEGASGVRPFNLVDLSITSHVRSHRSVGEDPTVGNLAERIVTGLDLCSTCRRSRAASGSVRPNPAPTGTSHISLISGSHRS